MLLLIIALCLIPIGLAIKNKKMKNKKIMFSFLILFCTNLWISAQQRVVDFESKQAIAGAHILSSKGALIGVSDKDGFILLSVNPETLTDTVSISHIAYDLLQVPFKEISSKGELTLTARENLLEELSVSAEAFDYWVLRGYYRSYEMNDKDPIYYFDGIVEFYVPRKKIKNAKYRLINHRSFRNQVYLDNEKFGSIAVIPNSSGVLNPFYAPPFPFTKKQRIESSKEKNQYNILKKNDIVGHIKTDNSRNSCLIYLDNLAPNKQETRSLFGYQYVNKKDAITARLNTTDLENITISNLESYKLLREFDFKYKKAENFLLIEGVDEFYVLSVSKAKKEDIKKLKLSDYYKNSPKESNIGDGHWLDFKAMNIPEVDKYIEQFFGKSLLMYEEVSENKKN